MKLTFLLLLLSTTAYAVGTEPGIPNLDQPERLGAVQPLKKADEARRLSQENAAKNLIEERISFRTATLSNIKVAISKGEFDVFIDLSDYSDITVLRQIQELESNGYTVIKHSRFLQVSW